MYDGNTVGVVVPAYNEAAFVGDVVETVPDFVDRVYVVDDASTDDTWQALAAHVAPEAMLAESDVDDRWSDTRGHRTVAIRHAENRGVGAAIKTGYARSTVDDVDVVAVMSGDGQMDPAVLDRIVEPVATGEADYAKGNRLIYPAYRTEMSSWRFFGNSLLSLLTKVASGYWRISDPQNGYTAISGSALDQIRIPELYDDYGFANHLLVRLNAHRLRVADVSMKAVYGEEESTIRYSSFVPRLSALLLVTFLWRLKLKYVAFDFHPLVVYYALGVTALGAAAGGAVAALWTWFAGGTPALLSGAIGALLLGGYSLATAMHLDREESTDLELRLYDPPGATRDRRPETTTGPILGEQE